jgi:hypothetical protein
MGENSVVVLLTSDGEALSVPITVHLERAPANRRRFGDKVTKVGECHISSGRFACVVESGKLHRSAERQRRGENR